MHCREIATGSNLEQGLQKCFFNAVDLRKIGSAPSVSGRHFGNAVGISLSMPPDELRAGLQNPAATVETTSHVPQDAVKPSGVSGAHYLSVLAAAAGAVRSALQALRAHSQKVRTQSLNACTYNKETVSQCMVALAFTSQHACLQHTKTCGQIDDYRCRTAQAVHETLSQIGRVGLG